MNESAAYGQFQETKRSLQTNCVNEFRMSLRKEIRQKITYVDNIEELEKDGEFLVNLTEDVIEEVQASEDVISMRNGCFLAMSRKLSVNQRIVFSLIEWIEIKEGTTATYVVTEAGYKNFAQIGLALPKTITK